MCLSFYPSPCLANTSGKQASHPLNILWSEWAHSHSNACIGQAEMADGSLQERKHQPAVTWMLEFPLRNRNKVFWNCRWILVAKIDSVPVNLTKDQQSG